MPVFFPPLPPPAAAEPEPGVPEPAATVLRTRGVDALDTGASEVEVPPPAAALVGELGDGAAAVAAADRGDAASVCVVSVMSE